VGIWTPISGVVDEWVIAPNDGWGIGKEAANNSALFCAFWWRERALSESEVSP
jgi:hypothetical protein